MADQNGKKAKIIFLICRRLHSKGTSYIHSIKSISSESKASSKETRTSKNIS